MIQFAEYTDDFGYTIRITDGGGSDAAGQMWIEHPCGEKVRAGLWLGWPEKEWNITEQQWQALSIPERASMEARWHAVNPAYRGLEYQYAFHLRYHDWSR